MPYNFIFNVFHTEGNIFPTLRTAFYVLYARPHTYIRIASHLYTHRLTPIYAQPFTYYT